MLLFTNANNVDTCWGAVQYQSVRRYSVAVVNQWSKITFHAVNIFPSTNHKVSLCVIQGNMIKPGRCKSLRCRFIQDSAWISWLFTLTCVPWSETFFASHPRTAWRLSPAKQWKWWFYHLWGSRTSYQHAPTHRGALHHQTDLAPPA